MRHYDGMYEVWATKGKSWEFEGSSNSFEGAMQLVQYIESKPTVIQVRVFLGEEVAYDSGIDKEGKHGSTGDLERGKDGKGHGETAQRPFRE